MLELTVRLIASLAVVVGLMLLLARLVGKRYGARAGAPVQVLHRQPLSRSASVAVITVGSRVLVVGATDQQVSLLTELDPEELADDESDADLLSIPTLAATPDATPDAAAPVTAPSLTALASAVTDRPSGGSHRAAPAPRRTPAAGGALTGSVLSPQTWRQALAAVTGKAS